jgi:hypothetical protein
LVDGNGNVHLVGYGADDFFRGGILAVKYDSNGNLLWATDHPPAPGEYVELATARLDLNGNLLVLGNSAAQERESDLRTLKFDSSGRHLWTSRYNGRGDTADYARSLAVDSSGHAYVAGYSYDLETSEARYVLHKYDSNGTRVWAVTPASAGPHDFPAAVRVDSAGNVFVAGQVIDPEDRLPGLSSELSTSRLTPRARRCWFSRPRRRRVRREAASPSKSRRPGRPRSFINGA